VHDDRLDAAACQLALVESAQAHWRAITGAHVVPLVRAGARFDNGILVERPEAAAWSPAETGVASGRSCRSLAG
jgi:hypothetical protein